MQLLLVLESEKDAITLCRLMNIFRRKGLKLATLALSSGSESYSIVVVAETTEAQADHLFHFLRRTSGVRHVTSYRPEAPTEAPFIFVDAAGGSVTLARLQEAFPESEIIFASGGKFLVSNPNRVSPSARELGEARYVPMAPAQSTRSAETQSLAVVLAG
jgi:hypothetical protein